MIELNILYNTEETQKLAELELDVPIEDSEERIMTFYRIDYIRKYYSKKSGIKEYSVVGVAGDEWICTLTYAELKKKLE